MSRTNAQEQNVRDAVDALVDCLATRALHTDLGGGLLTVLARFVAFEARAGGVPLEVFFDEIRAEYQELLVKERIRYGLPEDATLEEVIAAAQAARLRSRS